MEKQNIRIKLRAYDNKILDASLKQALLANSNAKTLESTS